MSKSEPLELQGYIETIVAENPYKIVISKSSAKSNPCKKITIQKIDTYYQAEKIIGTQAFHENLNADVLVAFIIEWLGTSFLQLNAYTEKKEYYVLISKKGRIRFASKANQGQKEVRTSHNRKKEYIFEEGQIIEPLIDMGIFTKDGKVVQSMQSKFRQINRFIETIDEVISKKEYQELNILDFGCGKGYLSFLIYYYLQSKNIKVNMVGIDLKEDVIEKCNHTAKKYNYTGLNFVCTDIRTYEPEVKPDMVISLHACDIATDFVLYHAIQWQTEMIFSIPCCQHELNQQIKTTRFPIITEYGLFKENISALFTDMIRSHILTFAGYKVQVLDIVSPLITPKNIMIRGVKTNISASKKARVLNEIKSLIDEFSLRPKLVELMKSDQTLAEFFDGVPSIN